MGSSAGFRALSMNAAYRPLVLIALVCAGLAGVYFVSPGGGKEVIPWRTDFNAAAAEANRAQKPVFLYLTANWCGPCQSLKHTLWADPRVAAALSAYVPVKVDIDQRPDLAERYGVAGPGPAGGIPAFRILDAQGKVIGQSVGAVGTDEFLAWLARRDG